MARTTASIARKRRLRTELSEVDEALLNEAVALFGLPKAELVRRLIRASVQAGPALSAGNSQIIIELTGQVRMATRYLSQVLKAIRAGRAVGIEDTEAVWSELHEAITAINDELTGMTHSHGSKLRRAARLCSPGVLASSQETAG